MPEAIVGAAWAFSWGLVAASGVLAGAILGLTANLGHRAIAAFMSLGASVLLSAASLKAVSEGPDTERRGAYDYRDDRRCCHI